MTAAILLILLKGICTVLRFVRWSVKRLHEWLPYPADAELMSEGVVGESLEFVLLGDLECLMEDHLDPAIALLRRAGSCAPRRVQ